MKSAVFISLLLIPVLGSSVALAASTANPVQSHESIREAARVYAEQLAGPPDDSQKTSIRVAKLDRRLKLAECSRPLTAFSSPNTKNVGRTTVGVRCDGEKPWKLYVAVNIQVMKNVVTLQQPVARNSLLQAADLTLVEKDVAGLHSGYFTSIDALVGKFTKSALQSGTVIVPSQIKNPMAIKKGTMVTILADVGGIEVRMKGKALKSGALGDWISVRNLSSNRKVEGRVTESGVIQVTL